MSPLLNKVDYYNYYQCFQKDLAPAGAPAGTLLGIAGCITSPAFSTRGKGALGPLLSAPAGASKRETPTSNLMKALLLCLNGQTNQAKSISWGFLAQSWLLVRALPFCSGFADLPSSVMPLTSSSLIIISTLWYRHLQLPVHTRDKNMFCRPIKIQSFDNQTSKSTHPLWNVLAQLTQWRRQAFEGKQSRSAMCLSILCLEFWKSEWMKLLFLIWMPTQLSTEKHRLTFCHSAGANSVISFMTFSNTTALTGISKHESCIFYLGRGFFKFFSFSICLITFRLFLLLFLNEPFTWAHRNLHLLVGEEILLVFLLYSFLVLDTLTVWAQHGDLFSCRRFQIWFGALLKVIDAVLMLFDALTLLFTFKRSYRIVMFKTVLLWPLDFRVDSERKWRRFARYSTDNVEVKTFFINSPHIVKDHCRYPTEIPQLISFILIFIN